MRIGPFRIDTGKNYSDLVQIINREKGSTIANLKGSPQLQLAEYKSWVFTCVSLISERISTIPYNFYRSDTGEKVTSSSKSYRIFSKPFLKPNDLMTFRFIKSFCQIQLDLCGMTCIYVARNALGQPWELWPLNMNDFISVDITNNFLNPKITYTFKFDDRNISFDIRELIVINYPNPANMYYPMSPIQAQAYSVDIDSYVEVYERDFFKNSARIDMALATDEELDQEKADEIKERWKSKYTGNFHDIAVLSSGLKPIPLKFTNKDFEFLNLAGWSKSKIFGCYKVPVSKAGGDNEVNRSGSVTADIAFNRECIQPRLTLFDEELTQGILHQFDERLYIKHENPIPRDRDLEVKEARVYLAGLPGLTINEWREERGLKAIENGDRLFISSNVIPLDEVDEYLLNPNNSNQGTGNNATDPTRHDGDQPNVKPDGSDDRDENPTDGRGLSDDELTHKLIPFQEYENSLRSVWTFYISEFLKNTSKDKLKQDLENKLPKLIGRTIETLSTFMGVKPIDYDVNHWVSPTSKKLAFEYFSSIIKFNSQGEKTWKDYIHGQLETNPRVAKISNTLLKATINYTKWLIMTDKKINMEWKINGNECGHKGRLENIKTTQSFPNQIPNFSCDCTIQPAKEI